MNFSGSIYGVVLNDTVERARLADAFGSEPYRAPPKAPVVYMKPASSVARQALRVPEGGLVAAPTLALLFARDACRVDEATALRCLGAACLAIDASIPADSYYRPAVAQKNGDDTLWLGQAAAPVLPDAIVLEIDGAQALHFPLSRLSRSPAQLVADLSQFMTLRAGDLLMIGLPGDAPVVAPGAHIGVRGGALPAISIEAEGATT